MSESYETCRLHVQRPNMPLWWRHAPFKCRFLLMLHDCVTVGHSPRIRYTGIHGGEFLEFRFQCWHEVKFMLTGSRVLGKHWKAIYGVPFKAETRRRGRFNEMTICCIRVHLLVYLIRIYIYTRRSRSLQIPHPLRRSINGDIWIERCVVNTNDIGIWFY